MHSIALMADMVVREGRGYGRQQGGHCRPDIDRVHHGPR